MVMDDAEGWVVDCEAVAATLEAPAMDLGMDGAEFATHSLRIGGATRDGDGGHEALQRRRDPALRAPEERLLATVRVRGTRRGVQPCGRDVTRTLSYRVATERRPAERHGGRPVALSC